MLPSETKCRAMLQVNLAGKRAAYGAFLAMIDARQQPEEARDSTLVGGRCSRWRRPGAGMVAVVQVMATWDDAIRVAQAGRSADQSGTGFLLLASIRSPLSLTGACNGPCSSASCRPPKTAKDRGGFLRSPSPF
jgi:hypothetical protein